MFCVEVYGCVEYLTVVMLIGMYVGIPTHRVETKKRTSEVFTYIFIFREVY